LCFSQDLSASQTAKILNINRNTINKYYTQTRQKIAATTQVNRTFLARLSVMKVNSEQKELEENVVVALQAKHLSLDCLKEMAIFT